jgi:hypothetical protein
MVGILSNGTTVVVDRIELIIVYHYLDKFYLIILLLNNPLISNCVSPITNFYYGIGKGRFFFNNGPLVFLLRTHTTTREELSRDWTLRASAADMLPFMPDNVGDAWNADTHIDAVGINMMEKTMILGECLWRLSAVGRVILS